jgi:thioredoxin reductase (NADPH)
MVPVLTVYSRSYCHLCDDMIAQLRPLEARHGFTLTVVDVDADAALETRYGEWVPVLMAGDEEICHYHLDPDKLRAYLAEKR